MGDLGYLARDRACSLLGIHYYHSGVGVLLHTSCDVLLLIHRDLGIHRDHCYADSEMCMLCPFVMVKPVL